MGPGNGKYVYREVGVPKPHPKMQYCCSVNGDGDWNSGQFIGSPSHGIRIETVLIHTVCNIVHNKNSRIFQVECLAYGIGILQ